jgi:hypothetical protein
MVVMGVMVMMVVTTTIIYLSIYLWLYSLLLGLGRFFNFLIFYTAGKTPWGGAAHRKAATCTQDSSNTE